MEAMLLLAAIFSLPALLRAQYLYFDSDSTHYESAAVDGNYILIGGSLQLTGGAKGFATFYDSGNLIWSKKIQGSTTSGVPGCAIQSYNGVPLLVFIVTYGTELAVAVDQSSTTGLLREPSFFAINKFQAFSSDLDLTINPKPPWASIVNTVSKTLTVVMASGYASDSSLIFEAMTISLDPTSLGSTSSSWRKIIFGSRPKAKFMSLITTGSLFVGGGLGSGDVYPFTGLLSLADLSSSNVVKYTIQNSGQLNGKQYASNAAQYDSTSDILLTYDVVYIASQTDFVPVSLVCPSQSYAREDFYVVSLIMGDNFIRDAYALTSSRYFITLDDSQALFGMIIQIDITGTCGDSSVGGSYSLAAQFNMFKNYFGFMHNPSTNLLYSYLTLKDASSINYGRIVGVTASSMTPMALTAQTFSAASETLTVQGVQVVPSMAAAGFAGADILDLDICESNHTQSSVCTGLSLSQMADIEFNQGSYTVMSGSLTQYDATASAACPVKCCTLYTGTACSTLVSSSSSIRIAQPWRGQIFFDATVATSMEVCLKCSNLVQTAISNAFKVTVCSIPSYKDPWDKAQALSYLATEPGSSIYRLPLFTEDPNCPITGYSVKTTSATNDGSMNSKPLEITKTEVLFQPSDLLLSGTYYFEITISYGAKGTLLVDKLSFETTVTTPVITEEAVANKAPVFESSLPESITVNVDRSIRLSTWDELQDFKSTPLAEFLDDLWFEEEFGGRSARWPQTFNYTLPQWSDPDETSATTNPPSSPGIAISLKSISPWVSLHEESREVVVEVNQFLDWFNTFDLEAGRRASERKTLEFAVNIQLKDSEWGISSYWISIIVKARIEVQVSPLATDPDEEEENEIPSEEEEESEGSNQNEDQDESDDDEEDSDEIPVSSQVVEMYGDTPQEKLDEMASFLEDKAFAGRYEGRLDFDIMEAMSNFGAEEEAEPMAAWVQEISPMGDLSFSFNQTLNERILKIEDFDEKLVDFTLISEQLQEQPPSRPSSRRRQLSWFWGFLEEQLDKQLNSEVQSMADRLGFTWEVSSIDYSTGEIKFKLDFTDPLIVSSGEEPDLVEIKLKTNLFFQGRQGGSLLEDQFRTVRAKVVRQAPQGKSTQSLSSGSEISAQSMGITTFLAFIMDELLSGVFKQLMGVILALQIIIHLLLLSVMIPPNVAIFLKALKPIAGFNVLKYFALINKFIFSFNDIAHEELRRTQFPREIVELGYSYSNCIINYGLLGQLIILYFLNSCVVYPILSKAVEGRTSATESQVIKWASTKVSVMKKTLFFNPILGLFLGGFLPLSMGTYLNLEYPVKGSYFAEHFGYYFAVACSLMAFVVLPLSLLYLLKYTEDELQKGVALKKKIGVLYLKARPGRLSRLYNLWFIGRRFFLLVVAFRIQKYPSLQIMVFTFANLAIIIYSGIAEPLKTRFQRRQELFMDFITLECVCTLASFTDLNRDVRAQYLLGWYFILLVGSLIAVNAVFTIQKLLSSLRLSALRYYRRALALLYFRELEKQPPKPDLQVSNLKKRSTKRKKNKELTKVAIEKTAVNVAPHIADGSTGAAGMSSMKKSKTKKDLSLSERLEEKKLARAETLAADIGLASHLTIIREETVELQSNFNLNSNSGDDESREEEIEEQKAPKQEAELKAGIRQDEVGDDVEADIDIDVD